MVASGRLTFVQNVYGIWFKMGKNKQRNSRKVGIGLFRSENSLKNRFNNALGRAIRRIRKVECKKKIKTKKPISNRALTKILERLGGFDLISK